MAIVHHSAVMLERIFAALWAGWGISWFIAAAWRDRAVKSPARGSQLTYRLTTALGAVLLFRPAARLFPHEPRLWATSESVAWVMAAVTAAGLAFTWWARIALGRLWSGAVTRKAGHHVVDTGPYRLTRHPIYSGIMLAALATMLSIGRVSAMAGTALIWIGLYLKARLEEQFLREELGPSYDEYARRVPMLVPRVRSSPRST